MVLGPGATQVKEKAPVPPLAAMLITPVLAPLQTTLVDVGVRVMALGWVILNVEVLVHKLASLMVTVRVPALNPVTEEVVCPPGTQL